jgi:cobalamin biosynthetic protein CobC
VTSNIEHGGALDKAIARFGGMPGDWLDLSTGINPEHYPLPDIPAEVWNRLPDDRLLLGTCKLARDYYGLPEGAPIVAAPGTQALIQIIPSLTKPATVAILTPTYQEHAVSFAASGWQVVECAGIADIPDNATVAVIVNPNNPDGRVIAADELLALARTLGARGGFLVVDEAFADPHPEISAAALACHEPLIVLKSFGKFFGLAGVRLGFAIAQAGIVETIARRLGPWAVPGPALVIASGAGGCRMCLGGADCGKSAAPHYSRWLPTTTHTDCTMHCARSIFLSASLLMLRIGCGSALPMTMPTSRV